MAKKIAHADDIARLEELAALYADDSEVVADLRATIARLRGDAPAAPERAALQAQALPEVDNNHTYRGWDLTNLGQVWMMIGWFEGRLSAGGRSSRRIQRALVDELVPAKARAKEADRARAARAKGTPLAREAAAARRADEDAHLRDRARAMKRRNPGLSASRIAQILSNELGRSISRVRVGRWLR